MRRATGIGLVLLGGGIAFGLTRYGTTSAECREARTQGLPNAEELCGSSSRSGGSSSSSSSSWRSSGSGSSATTTTASARGGFGSSGGGGS